MKKVIEIGPALFDISNIKVRIDKLPPILFERVHVWKLDLLFKL
jgi:hypothetical protein